MSWEVLAGQLADLALPPRTRALVGLEPPLRTDLEGEVVHRATEGIRRLAAALCRGETDPTRYRQLISGLAGLGPGLTPTGDDLLVGAAAAACRLVQAGHLDEPPLSCFLQALGSLPPGSTTPTGRQMIQHAAGREFAQPLLDFISVLGAPGPAGRSLAGHAARLSRLGGQSGCDFLAGALALVRIAKDGAQDRHGGQPA
jgi:hypothetical protein